MGHEGPVDQDRRAEHLVARRLQGREGVDQPVVPVEAAVGDHQRDVAIARGQRQRSVELVVDDPHPGQPAPDVAGGAVEAVVVVPLKRGAFRPPLLPEVVDVGFPLTGRNQQVVARLARGEVARDPAEVGDRLARGEAAGLAVEPAAVVAAVQVHGQLAGLGRELVVEGDPGPLPGGTADGGAGEAAAEGPEAGLRTGEDLGLGLPDRDLDPGVGEDPRDRQLLAERLRRHRLRDLVAERPQRAAALPRQQGRERAPAQGAEEGSAPQAARG